MIKCTLIEITNDNRAVICVGEGEGGEGGGRRGGDGDGEEERRADEPGPGGGGRGAVEGELAGMGGGADPRAHSLAWPLIDLPLAPASASLVFLSPRPNSPPEPGFSRPSLGESPRLPPALICPVPEASRRALLLLSAGH